MLCRKYVSLSCVTNGNEPSSRNGFVLRFRLQPTNTMKTDTQRSRCPRRLTPPFISGVRSSGSYHNTGLHSAFLGCDGNLEWI